MVLNLRKVAMKKQAQVFRSSRPVCISLTTFSFLNINLFELRTEFRHFDVYRWKKMVNVDQLECYSNIDMLI